MIKKLFSLVALLLALAACTADLDNMTDGSRQAKAGGDDVVFYASIEGADDGEAETKVYADEKMRVLWNANDRISIFNKSTYGYQYRFTGTDGANAGGFSRIDPVEEFQTGEDLESIYAVYPYSPRTSVSYDGIVSVMLPQEQIFEKNSFGIGANTMVSVSSGTMLKFKNVGGYLSFRFYGDGAFVKRITLRGNNHEKLSGIATVTMPENGVPTVLMQDKAQESVALKAYYGLAELGATESNSIEFWFVIPPTTFSQGFTVTVQDDKGGIFEKATSNEVVVARNRLVRMKPMQVTITPAQFEAVDLGLSVKWATFNVGASSSEEYGDFFAWGETLPKFYYNWSSYKWCNGSSTTLIKYNTSSDYGSVDNLTTLQISDDAARVNWGGSWRMPTDAEWTELRTKCDWEWTTQNGINGYLVKSKTNTNSIFLPAAGYRIAGKLYDVGLSGDYWSSSISTEYPSNAYDRLFGSDGVYRIGIDRYCGLSVRPVTN